MFKVDIRWKGPDGAMRDADWYAKAVQIEGSRLTLQCTDGYTIEYNMSFVLKISLEWRG